LELSGAWLNRRGPDGHGRWLEEHNRVELRHFRLAIVDPDERATQPMSADQEQVHLVFNGEIYNHQELRVELNGHDFKTESDTEVIMALYLTEGVDGFRRLRGMFTLVIVDMRLGQVMLHRDAIGKKPLYLYQTAEGAAFSSSIMPLLAMLNKPLVSQEAVLDHYWDNAYIQPWLSVDERIRPLMPSELLVLDLNGQTVRQCSIVPNATVLHEGEPQSEIHERIDQLLDQAVERRLHNNPNPVSLLSGGVDSTIVTERAVRLSCVPVTALTVGSLIPFSQDERFARFAARRLQLPLTRIRPGGEALCSQVDQALSDQDEPLGMPAFFLLHRLVRSAREIGKILLSGDGGDEVFLGYRSPQDWVGKRPESEQDRFEVGPPTPDWYNYWAVNASKSTLLGHMMPKVDRASAEQGAEIRSPLLDWDLMAYVRSLPQSIHLAQEVPKHLLKAQLNHWPRSFVHRKKLGFSYYLRWHWWLNRFNGLRELIEDEALETFEARLPDALKCPSDCWTSTTILNHFEAVWRLLTWSAFIRRVRQAEP